ncbi:MAG TPA: hypothetical protein VLZ12_05855 [Verrucomicrobiae bacterium]|nr:hypothetical protein [Verrucomicrobiae bacterium]
MAEIAGLQGQRVKIILRRFHPQTPRETIRGIITEVDEFGFRVSGRRFQELSDLETSLPVERPAEPDNKVYWVPFNSIRYSEIILPGSTSEQLDNEIQRRKPLTAQEIGRQSPARSD